MTGSERAEPAERGGRAALKFGLLVAFIAAIIVAWQFTPLGDYVTRARVLELLRSIRSWRFAEAAFIGLYALAAVLALPGSVLTLAGGAIFGVWPGTLYNLIGATLGATLAFLIARYLGRDFVAARLGGWAERLDRRIGDHGLRTILILRVAVVVPFNAMNYASGLTSVRLRDYVIGSAIGMLPATFVYTYFADALLAGSLEARREALVNLAIAGAMLVALALAPVVWRRWRGRSGEAAAEEPPPGKIS
ncbi:MAG: TVP38/TMEM64 family protein [Longimicrobiales bacterium]